MIPVIHFWVMESHESPRHPFWDFFFAGSRATSDGHLWHWMQASPICFKPRTCSLQEQHLFSHWRGHLGCSGCYSLDSYTSLDVASINSQVNEQANAGLQRIKGHIAYMKPDNFMFHVKLFLGLQNRDKQSKLDVGNLKLWCIDPFIMPFLSTCR